jgi:hypothetical protein
MQKNPKNILSDQDVFELFESARVQYEKYLEIKSFQELSIFEEQEKRVHQIIDDWKKPLDLCLFKERKDAFME